MHFSFVRLFRAGLIVVISLTALMHKASADEVSDRQVHNLQQLMQHAGFSFTYERLELNSGQSNSNDGFTLHGITLIRFGIEDPFKLRSLSLKGIQELSGIGLAASEMVFTGFSWDGRDIKGNELLAIVPTIKITGLYLPDPGKESAPLFFHAKTSFLLKNLALLRDGEELFSLKSITAQLENVSAKPIATAVMAMKDANFHTDNFYNNSRLKRLMTDLSIDNLTFISDAKAHWNTKTGTVTLQHFTLDHRQIGKFVVAGRLGGYSEFLIRRLRAINTDILNLPVEQRDQASMRMLGELSAALKLEHLRLSFSEKTMVKNFIAIQSQAMGLSPDGLAKLLPALAAMRLSRYLSAQLVQSLRSSLTNFLSNPQTFTLDSTPHEPQSLSNMVSLALLVPALLLDKLNITAQAH